VAARLPVRSRADLAAVPGSAPVWQNCHVGDRHVDFLWLVPITKSERDFKIAHGQEELEQRFEAAGLRYWEIERDPVA
jgi:Suppressor of fused protein (SUFU)